MEFNRGADGRLEPLPAPSIDTGMGLERITAVLQKKDSNYDTDLFTPLLGRIGELAGVRYGRDREHDVSMRVVADHARATTFLIADGVIPSNEFRGYVLRKIMRRAMRHGKHLGLSEPFLHRLVDVLVREMGDAYPEIGAQPRDDREDDPRRRAPLRHRVDRRPAAPRSGDRPGAGTARACAAGRRGVPALRHVRDSLRLHRRHRRHPRPARRPRRLRPGDAGPARYGAREERVRGQPRGSRLRASRRGGPQGRGGPVRRIHVDARRRRAGRRAVRQRTPAG